MKTKGTVINEDALVARILPRIEEKIKNNVVRSIILALEEQIYPPEEDFNPQFIGKVEKASKGKGRKFKSVSELSVHLTNLGK